MEIIAIAEKLYGDIDYAVKAMEDSLRADIGDLDVEYRAYPDEDGWVIVELKGEDAEAAANYLLEKHGRPAEQVEEGRTYTGRIEHIDKKGMIVDVGIPVLAPRLDELGQGTPLQIAERFGLIRMRPIEIEITRNGGNPFARISKEQADRLWAWRKDTHQRVVVNGATRSQVKSALAKKGHGKDVLGVEKLGFLEQVIVCREGTDAPGIISSIGPLLNSEMKAIIPR